MMLRKLFPLVREAVASILPVETLRYIALYVEDVFALALGPWLFAGFAVIASAIKFVTGLIVCSFGVPAWVADGGSVTLDRGRSGANQLIHAAANSGYGLIQAFGRKHKSETGRLSTPQSKVSSQCATFIQ